MSRLIAIIALLLSVALGGSALADVRPDEMAAREIAGGLSLHYPQRFEPAARQIEEAAPATAGRIADGLGLEDLSGIEVWILPEVDDYFEVNNLPGRPPEWAVGLSLSDRSVVVLVNGVGPGGELVDLQKTFAHELAHVAIDRARAGGAVPRWFHEGFAVMLADEWTPERSELLSRAAASGSLKSFAELSRTFPPHQNTASVAYAQSFHFVRDVMSIAGDDVFARILDKVARGWKFEAAFASEVGDSISLAEARWSQRLQSTMSGWSVLNDGTFGFFGAALLFIVAWLVRRKRTARKFASMEDAVGNWDYDESKYPLPGAPK